jgi:ubiquinone/menaquinone biosynthesis C-methylase UbiE
MNQSVGIIVVFLMGQLLTGVCLAGAASKEEGKTFYSSVPTAYMDDPRRAEWQKPEKVVDHLLIKQGDIIADIGAGTGFFTMLFAQRVGKNGMVYAVDVDENMVQYVEKRAKKEGLNNVKTILATPNEPLLPKSSTDVIFICDTYLFFENREQYLARLRDSLKNDGHLAIVSFNMKAEIPGAPPSHKMIPRERTIQEAEKAGFALEAEYFFLPYQDFLVFGKR